MGHVLLASVMKIIKARFKLPLHDCVTCKWATNHKTMAPLSDELSSPNIRSYNSIAECTHLYIAYRPILRSSTLGFCLMAFHDSNFSCCMSYGSMTARRQGRLHDSLIIKAGVPIVTYLNAKQYKQTVPCGMHASATPATLIYIL